MSNNSWKPVLPTHKQHKRDIYQQIIKTGEFVYQIGELDEIRQKSKPVNIRNITSREFKKKVSYVKKCLLKYRKITGKGRGITAVQVGIPEAFAVIYCHSEFISESQNYKTEILNQVQDDGGRVRDDVDRHPIDKNGLLVIINPKIIKRSTKLLKYPEMCMSAAPVISPNIRPSWIEFEYFDENSTKRHWTLKDIDKKARMYNRVFQHEIDHINGIINIDRVKSKELIFESDPHFYEKAKFKDI